MLSVMAPFKDAFTRPIFQKVVKSAKCLRSSLFLPRYPFTNVPMISVGLFFAMDATPMQVSGFKRNKLYDND
jgi:hypothetical protein